MSRKKLINKDRINARTWWIVSAIVLIVCIWLIFLWNLVVHPQLLDFYMVPHILERKTALLTEINTALKDPENIDYEKLEIIEEDYSVIINIEDSDGLIYNTFFHSHSDKDSKIEIQFVQDNEEGFINKINRIYSTKNGIKKGTVLGIKIDDEDVQKLSKTESEPPIYMLYEHKTAEAEFDHLKGKDLDIYYDTHSYTSITKHSNVSRVAINTAIIFVVWLFFSIIISGYQRRIQNINLSVKKVRSPDFNERCPAGTSDVGRLGRNINHLLDYIQVENDRLNNENRKLQEKINSTVRVEDDKKDFLANTAHELKTPISIIRGCAEGLKFGIAKGGRARQKYCDTIIVESEKMNNLVLELLELSKYNQKMYENVTLENFSIRSFIQAELKSMESIFKENSIDVENTISRVYMGRTDIEKQALVFRNYIKNAISHVDMYKKIVVSCEEKPDSYRIKVFNSGEKISESEKKKIWDSFYRVDKSHGRSEGRFGIGLQIVASIQDVLGMDYGVKNVHGGVQFWFEVKKASKD